VIGPVRHTVPGPLWRVRLISVDLGIDDHHCASSSITEACLFHSGKLTIRASDSARRSVARKSHLSASFFSGAAFVAALPGHRRFSAMNATPVCPQWIKARAAPKGPTAMVVDEGDLKLRLTRGATGYGLAG
jgi:hypothetical protein